jgi:hypothetical protein
MNEILIKMVDDWWNTEGTELSAFLSELSGDASFQERLHISDRVNVFNYAKLYVVHQIEEVKDYLLKEVCGELAEQVLASKNGVSPDELFDHDGCFHVHYQDEFNRLYDRIEEKITDLESINQLN